MQIVYGDNVIEKDYSTVSNIARVCNITKETAGLLYCRGFDTPEKVNRFLNPGKKGFFDPFLLTGMRDAVNVLCSAKTSGKSVFIFGDYDADGICSVSVLKACLEEFGITPRYTVPEREEGYGLNLDLIKRFHEESPIDVLITVDCGISDYEVIEEIKKLGITVIVTDHHEPPSKLPDTIVIDPKIEGQEYPFNKLSGAGVAYKLGNALIGDGADKYLDIVALSTVADSMELVGENRDIVFEGLKIFNSNDAHKPLKYLLGENQKQITAGTLAYTVSPRVNAGGRMGDAKCALKLMTSTDEKEMFDLAVKLNEYNIDRQVGCDAVYNSAKKKIKENGLIKNKVLLVADDEWQAGFIGIVASKLAEEYMRPVIVFAKHGDDYKGSSRSVDDVNIYDAISSAQDLLITFGGHSQAAGVTVSKENFSALQERLNAFVDEHYTTEKPVKKIYVDCKIDGKFSLDFAREIERMEPFGIANKRPLFAVEVESVKSNPIKAGSVHFAFNTKAVEMLDFNGAGHVDLLALPVKKTVIFDTNLSTFKGREYLKGYLRQVVTTDDDLDKTDLYTFSASLKSLTEETLDESLVEDASGIDLTDQKATVYAVSDVKNLSLFPKLSNLPVSFYTVQDKSMGDKIVVAPKEFPQSMGRVVWLDEPIAFVKTDLPTYCNFDLCGYENLEYVDTDREIFAEVYNVLRTFDGSDFTSSAEFYLKNNPMENGYQFVFSTEVFMELGLITVEMGKLKVVSGVRNPLTNSKIYSKVYEIRG